MRNTLVVNLIAGSGAGKSKMAYWLSGALKDMGIEIELVTEYVKEMVWEGRTEIFKCQPYIFGKQLYKLQRVAGKVAVIVTDRPIFLDVIYDPEQDEDFRKYILKKFNQFNNVNVFLNRTKDFSPIGRNENSIEEAIACDNKIKETLNELYIPYFEAESTEEGCKEILDAILSRLIIGEIYNNN
jgi:hypothetical protein